MAVLYVNNFDNIRLIRQLSPGKEGPIINWLSGAVPAYDPPTLLSPPPQVVEWGPMYEGASTTPSNGTFVTPPVGPFNQPTGVTLTLKNNASASQSKTLYLVYPNDDLVRRGKVFTAELVFDMPMADDPQVPPPAPAPGWSVALNFKTGGSPTDAPTDARIGVMCHFSDNGTVKFHGTDNPGLADATTTYAQYGASPASEFALTVELIINQGANPVISGTGSLRYGDKVLVGNLTLPAPPFDFTLLNAVGVAVVTNTNGFDHFGARLRSFTLSGA